MSHPPQLGSSYSADVRIELTVNGHVLCVAQLGPDFVILRQAPAHPPTPAAITLSVDGRVKRWPVYLPDGIVAGQMRTRVKDVGAGNTFTEASSSG